jgi:hypothetical protein
MRKLALKRSLNYAKATNPSTAILGMSHVCMHVIYENNKTSATPALGSVSEEIEHDGMLRNVTRHDKKRQMT